MEGFIERLKKGDTITLGIDYYALFPISKNLLDALDTELFFRVYNEIIKGEVVVLEIWYDKKLYYKRRI